MGAAVEEVQGGGKGVGGGVGVDRLGTMVIARTGVSPGVESIMTGQDGGDSAIGCRIRVSGGGSDTRYRVVAAERAKQSTGGARESRSRE